LSNCQTKQMFICSSLNVKLSNS